MKDDVKPPARPILSLPVAENGGGVDERNLPPLPKNAKRNLVTAASAVKVTDEIAPRRLKHWRAWRDLMLHDLALVLKCEASELPRVFCTNVPKPLKIGVFENLVQRYPRLDQKRLSVWLEAWVERYEYLKRTAKGKHRHDLDGNDVEEISERDRRYATMRVWEIDMREMDRRNRWGIYRWDQQRRYDYGDD